MKEVIIFGLILIVVAFIGEYYMKKKFNINRKVNNISKSIKRLERIVLGITFIIYLVASSVLIFKYDDFNIMFVFIPFFLVISLIRTFTQWQYNRHANIWILELFTIFILSFLFIVMHLFLGVLN